MGYNIVTNYLIINEVKRCRYFQTNLGLVATVDKGGRRVYNEKDQFSFYYNTLYKTTILGQGNVGDVKFYTDHLIRDPVLAVYCGSENVSSYEEFIFDMDFKLIRDKGIDHFIGHMLKETEIQYEERIKSNIEKKIEPKKLGNAEMLTKNPGSVTYNDLKEYLELQNRNRYSVNENNNKL